MDNNISKFKINKITLLSTWCYNLPNNVDCTICRTNLNCNSIYAEDKCYESIVVSGMCGHSFHNECIDTWLKPNNSFSNTHCPICSNKWIYKK
jgi:anaphase-promoting complex subunit 11